MSTRRTARPADRAYDPAADTSQLSFVQRGRRETEAGAGPSAAHAFDVADASFDAGCADVAAEYGVSRPAAVVARYVTEWAVSL